MGKKQFAYINGEILKWLREQTPLSLFDVSEILSINQSDLMLWEDKQYLPSITQARKLAKLYKVPLASLYLSEVPKISLVRYVDRRTQTTDIPKITASLWDKLYEMVSYRHAAIELLDNEDFYFNTLGIDINANETDLSLQIRKWLGIKTPINISAFKGSSFNYFKSFFEAKNILVFRFSSIPVEEVRGISLHYNVLPFIGVNNNDSDAAKTFTLFHELTHILKRNSSMCSVEEFDSDTKEELYCNRVAAEVLMPKAILKEDKHISRIINNWDDNEVDKCSRRYGVSKQALIRKLYDIKLIDKELFESKNTQYQEEYLQIKKQHEIFNKKQEVKLKYSTLLLSRIGNLYPSIVFDALYSGKITYGQVSQYLNVKTKHISKIESAVFK